MSATVFCQRPHPLLRKIAAPSETRIGTLIHAIGADLLDDLIGGWLRGLADAGRPDGAADRDRGRKGMAARRVGRPDEAVRRDPDGFEAVEGRRRGFVVAAKIGV